MNHNALKIATIFCLIGLSVPLFSQKSRVDKKNYALLWEITGKGLTKPSYLFGTMHLRDKRVFEFTDSVLLKLESCEAFASEIRMDSAIYQSWELAVSGDTTNRLSRQLSPKAYQRLLKALKDKGINMDSLDSKNATLVHDWLNGTEDNDNKADSKDLFLDLYLTRLAYKQGKTLHGLERLADYEDLNDSFFQQFEDSSFVERDTAFSSLFIHFAYLEQMINVYNSGDLDAMLGIIKSEKNFNGSQHKREMLDNRNVRMVQRMEELMQQKSVFCAVGTAHLPDSMGLLALLRDKGYSLRKVTPQFTGLSDKFVPKTIEKEWFHLKDDFNSFELDFPETPYLMNKLNANTRRLGVENLYFDITTGAIMISEVSFYPHIGQKKQSQELILNEPFARWVVSRGFINIQKEQIKIGDNIGYKFSARLPSKALVKGRFFVANNNIYKSMVFFDKHNEGQTERADRFLESLKINPLPLTDWQVFEDGKAAFSIKMPVKPEFQETKTKVPTDNDEILNYYINLFISKEATEGFMYMVRYSDMPTGQYIEDDSFYMAQIMAESVDKFRKLKAKVEVDSLTRHYGYPEYNIKISIEGVTMFMRNILRGNRLYFLLGQPPLEKNKTNTKKLEDWLNSFRFLPFAPPKLTKKEFPDMGFSLGLPTAIEPPKRHEIKAIFPHKLETAIQTSDNQTSASFGATKTEFSKYYSAINADSFWTKYTRDLVSSPGAKVKSEIKDTIFRGIKAKLLTLEYLKTQNVFKSLIFLKDGYEYEFSLVLPFEIANNSYSNIFFDAIELMENNEKKDIFSSKKQLIINDLASAADSIRKEAKAAFTQTDWSKEDLPLLTNALQKSYPDDTLDYNSIRTELLNQIIVFKDASTLSVLSDLAKTTDKDTALQNAILCAFLTLDTLDSANRFFELAKAKNKLDFKKFYCLTEFMSDSVARAKLYFEKLLALSDKPFEEPTIISITESLAHLDSLHLMRDVFIQNTPQYLATANALMLKNAKMLKQDTLAEDEYKDYYLLIDYIGLFENIPNTPEINQFLRKMTSTNQIYLLKQVVMALAKLSQPIENSTWQKILKDKYNWFTLLSHLKYESLLSKVPPQYVNQKDIAEGSLLNYMADEYGEPKEMTLLDTQKYKGESLYIFKCFMDFGKEENNYYIAICAQPLDKTKYNFDPSLLLISEQLPDAKNYKKVVDELLKDFEKNKAGN